jgi:indolepyruvate ferredoxin oxidoreductase beta subunit
MKDTIRLIIVAVGGQGNLLASKVLGEAALSADIPMHMSEIHGMAQRGGVVESAIVFGPAKSTIISDGEADVMVGFEPLETLRALNRCNPRTTVITNLAPTPPFTAAIGKGQYPDIENTTALLSQKVGRLLAFDATALARQAGNVLSLNMVLLGALVASETLPISRAAVEATIREKTKAAFVDVNLKALELGADAVIAMR